MSTKMFTHGDLDGCGNVIVMGLTDERSLSVEYAEPNTIDSRIIKFISDGSYVQFDTIYITDLVINEETAKLIDQYNNNYGCNFRLYDHHKTSENLSKYMWTDVSERVNGNNTCATELFFNSMVEQNKITITNPGYTKLVEFVELVRLWDTWDWVNSVNVVKGLQARDLHTLFTINNNKCFVDTIINKIVNCEPLINTYDKTLIDFSNTQKDLYIKSKLKNVKFQNLTVGNDIYRIALTCAEKYISEIGTTICDKNEDVDIAVIIIPDFNRVCLRTTKDIDLSKIAEYYGGGGHEKAAGFICSSSIINTIYSDVFCA